MDSKVAITAFPLKSSTPSSNDAVNCALCDWPLRAPFRHTLSGAVLRFALSSERWSVGEEKLGFPVCCSHFASHRDCTHTVCDTLSEEGSPSQSEYESSKRGQDAAAKVSPLSSNFSQNNVAAASLSFGLASPNAITSLGAAVNQPPPPVMEALNNFFIVGALPSENVYGIVEGSVVRSQQNGAIYRVQGNMKHWFPNAGVWASHSNPSFSSFDAAVLEALPTAPAYILPRGFQDGDVVRIHTTGHIYRLVLGRKCWYPSMAIYTRLGSPAFKNYSAVDLQYIPDGPDFQ